MKQLESGFKRTIHWNKYQSKISEQAQNRYLGFLIDRSFQGVNRLSILSSEDKDHQKKLRAIFCSDCRNKRLQCYDRWKKFL